MSDSRPAIQTELGGTASAYLDGLRALASNLVIASHVLALYFKKEDRFAFGNLGVTIFFLLSGFLIAQSMLNWSARSGPRLPGFIADRTARIFTPYVPALILIAIVDALFVKRIMGQGNNEGFATFFGNLFMLQDHSVFQFFDLAGFDLPWRIRPYNTAEPFWTVAIEFWIYVAAGLFVFVLVQKEKISRPWVLAAAALCAPVAIWNAAAGGGKSLSLIWLIGALVGYLFHSLQLAKRATTLRAAAIMALTGSLIALPGHSLKAGFHPFDVQTALLIAIAMFSTLLLCMSLHIRLGQLPMFLASYSYSLYLLHNTVLVVLVDRLQFHSRTINVVVAVACAHLCAFVFYLSVERHYRSIAQRLRPIFTRWMLVKPAARLSSDGRSARESHAGMTKQPANS
jgi:peptidoglycan/LPS O-acetylase OafA/YrhL